MIVVSDTTPLNYLILLGLIDSLSKLYGRVIVPQAVLAEMQHPKAPAQVQAWVAELPSWVDVHTAVTPDSSLDPSLGPGEREAISIAMQGKVDIILMDELLGRSEARIRNLRVTGTLGILVEIALSEELDFKDILASLRPLGFYLSDELEHSTLDRYASRLPR